MSIRRVGGGSTLEAQRAAELARRRAEEAAEQARKLLLQKSLARLAAKAKPGVDPPDVVKRLGGGVSLREYLHKPKPLLELAGQTKGSVKTAGELQDFKSQIAEVRAQARKEGRFLTVGEARLLVEERNLKLEKGGGKLEKDKLPPPGGMGGVGGAMDEFAAERKRQLANQKAIEQAIETGRPVTYTNSQGEEQTVSVEKKGDEYEVRVGDDSFDVSFEDTDQTSDADERAALDKLVDWYSATPPDYRENLKQVNFTDEVRQTDTGVSAAAFAGGGKITFVAVKNGDSINSPLDQLSEGIFDHEMGHLVGAEVESERDSVAESVFGWLNPNDAPVPDEWADAVEADNATAPRDNDFDSEKDELVTEDGDVLMTEYATDDANVDDNFTEDFAESWAKYQEAKKNPELMAEFRERYPHRAALLDEYYG